MTIKFEVPGKERKRLVQTIAAWLGSNVKYNGAPSFSYEVERFTVDRDGGMTFEGRADDEVIERLLEHLYDEGFQFETPAAEPEEEETRLSIAVPYDTVSVGNLTKLLDAKGSLIKRALGASDIRLTMEDDRVVFDWFDRELTPDEVNAYMVFITALCRMSKELKRVNASEKDVENEKYSFRCFLLRLGFIGENYKGVRKTLLSRLSGSAAFKSGAKGGQEDAISE